jgi:hypothetical protein
MNPLYFQYVEIVILLYAVSVLRGPSPTYILLRREGWKVNHKMVYRLCQKKGLFV